MSTFVPDKFKPCIVHRDVTSRNILVKMDGTCMLCDFGFAIQISGSTYVLNGTEVKAEETSLSDVCLRDVMLEYYNHYL